MTSRYITYVLTCEECSEAVGVFTDGKQEHIIVTKSYTLLSDTAAIVEKDHRPELAIDLREPVRWWAVDIAN